MNKKRTLLATTLAAGICALIVAGNVKSSDFWYLNSNYLRPVMSNVGIRAPKVQIVGSDNATSTAALAVTNSASTVALFANNGGNVGIGTTVPAAPLDITSTTGGILIPRMTGTQRDAISSPSEGVIIYNLSTHLINFYNGSAWQIVTSGS